jgi:hypothetical protein
MMFLLRVWWAGTARDVISLPIQYLICDEGRYYLFFRYKELSASESL